MDKSNNDQGSQVWKFDFRLRPEQTGQEISRSDADELMLSVIIDWAEERDFGVGGGYGPFEAGHSAPEWHFDFVLQANGDDRVVSALEAHELLWSVVQGWATEHKAVVTGTFTSEWDDNFTWLLDNG